MTARLWRINSGRQGIDSLEFGANGREGVTDKALKFLLIDRNTDHEKEDSLHRFQR